MQDPIIDPPWHPVIQAEASKGWRMQICGISHHQKSTQIALHACDYLSFPFCGGFLPQFPCLQRVMAMQDLLRMGLEFGPGGMSRAEPSVSPETIPHSSLLLLTHTSASLEPGMFTLHRTFAQTICTWSFYSLEPGRCHSLRTLHILSGMFC